MNAIKLFSALVALFVVQLAFYALREYLDPTQRRIRHYYRHRANRKGTSNDKK